MFARRERLLDRDESKAEKTRTNKKKAKEIQQVKMAKREKRVPSNSECFMYRIKKGI